MDAGSKTSDRDTPLSDPPPSDSDSSESETPTQETEWLATTRKRRSTAGNRMKSMLANEEPDSDLELLFAEDEDDQGFSDVGEDGSDVQMDSSSDDEDENNANADDLEGEKELERQAKERRAAQRKRKAQEAIPAKFRKKVRIDPTTTASAPAPAPRPKKKSERTSWLPSPADLPTRASSRKTTRISKEQLHQQMVEREAKRLKQLAQMEKKAARLEAMKKPPMTQEQRLTEAAIVEKRNSKSLNRWEEAEKQREEERKARLAALSQRTLKGPVITFWSGMGQWEELELRSLRPFVTEVEEKPKKKREKLDKGAAKGKVANDRGQESNSATKEESSAQPKVADSGDNTAAADTNKDKIITSEQTKQENVALVSRDDGVAQQSDSVPLHSKEKTLVAEPIVPVTGSDGDSAKPADSQPEAIGEEIANESATVATDEELIQISKQTPQRTVRVVPEEGEDAVSGNTKSPPEPPPSAPTADLSASSTTQNAPSSYPPVGLAAPPPPPPIGGPLSTQSSLSSRPSSVLAAPILERPFGIDVAESPPPNAQRSSVLAPPNADQDSSSLSSIRPPDSMAVNAEATSIAPPTPMDVDTKPALEPTSLPLVATDEARAGKSGDAPEVAAAAVPGPPRDMDATRNSIIFQNFDQHALRDKTIQTQILFGRKMTKLAKPAPAPICVITNNPARYRDPNTGLPFYNLHAYREIQRLNKGDYRWSRLVGAWVGSGVQAARGVPERFSNPDSEKPKEYTAATDGEKPIKEEQGVGEKQGKVVTKPSAEVAANLSAHTQQSKEPVVQQPPQVVAAQ